MSAQLGARLRGAQGDRDIAFAAFVAAFFVFHHIVAAVPVEQLADAIDLLTPFVVLGAFVWALLLLQPSRVLVAIALVAAVLYVDGHGIHLSANSIGRWPIYGTAADRAHFWDEIWGHIEWHAGLVALIAAVAWADRRRPARRWLLGGAAALLGLGLFTSGVEGGTWWLILAAGLPVGLVAFRARAPIAVACAAAFALYTLLLAIWAIWHQGMPQFSDLGWI